MSNAMTWSATANREVLLCGLGARTPLGRTAAASAAAVRAAISAVEAHPVFVDKFGKPMNCARDVGLPPVMRLDRRAHELLHSAVAAAVPEQLRSGGSSIECWIALPEARPGVPSDLQRQASNTVEALLGRSLSEVRAQAWGHAGGLMAMHLAAHRVAAGDVELAMTAGVDSYLDAQTMEWLDERGLLMSSDNRNGFPPGEAAGACLFASRRAAARYGLPVLASLAAASTATEDVAIRADGVCVGLALSAVLRGVITALQPGKAIAMTYCDLNGERYRNEEFTYTLLRVQKAFVDAHDYLCPADCWGDVGAASGPLFIALAAAAGQRGYSQGDYSVMFAGSESGYRAAVLLRTDKRVPHEDS